MKIYYAVIPSYFSCAHCGIDLGLRLSEAPGPAHYIMLTHPYQSPPPPSTRAATCHDVCLVLGSGGWFLKPHKHWKAGDKVTVWLLQIILRAFFVKCLHKPIDIHLGDLNMCFNGIKLTKFVLYLFSGVPC